MDHLLGLIENVIIGKLIPAGTGMERYRNIEVKRTLPYNDPLLAELELAAKASELKRDEDDDEDEDETAMLTYDNESSEDDSIDDDDLLIPETDTTDGEEDEEDMGFDE